jgi:serine/threonine protein kinase/Flp pilus assembly protein TadD
MNEESLFAEALEKKGEDRAAFLDEHCKGNTELRGRLEALLRAHDNPDPFLEAPAPEPPTTMVEAPAEGPGTVIGPYKLIQQIGEGGMGTVWMAQQTAPVKRLVAVKLIKAGMDSKQVIARFEAERQALALMEHANIARVLDAGTTPAGRPYFVMDLVRGGPITKYCDDHHLSPRQRLELFIPVCQALQHAHQKGIIHRDLKPSNVLVALYDGKPVPKIIDFGVAKAAGQTLTEKTLVTSFGAMVGTLEYMSPEQAEINQLDIDTRSDIYSLGVLLYELLTGTTPFTRKELEKGGMLEMLRVIREQEPSKPSTRLSTAEGLPTLAANRGTEPAKLMKLVRGELDWIVMKALDKDRNRRYEAANALAGDLQRYLADEPVHACPPSAAYRLRKFARRNKAALAMVSVVAAAALLVVGSLGWVARDRKAREHEVARDRVAREQEIAQDQATRQAVIAERVTLALEEARKRQQEGRWREALDAAKRADALTAAGGVDDETHRRVREVLGDMQMLANLEEVRARSTINEAGFDLKEEDGGTVRAFREYGIDIDALDRDEAARRIRDKSIRYELAVFLDSWSHVRRRLENRGAKRAGKDWKELLEVARAADPDPWRDQFRNAVLNNDRKALVELAASAPISSLPVETVDRLGDALMSKETIEEAADFLKKGQRLHPQDYWINVNLANCLLEMGPQHRDDAIRYYTAAVALRPEATLSYSNLANALATQGKLDEAIDCYRKAIEISPKRSWLHVRLAISLSRQGKPDEAAAVSREAGCLQLDEAVAACREAVRLRPDDPMAHFNLGAALGKQGKLDEAIAAYQEALRRKPDLMAKKIVNNLARDFVACPDPKARDPKQAAELLRQVMAQYPTFAQDLDPELLAGYAPMFLLADDTDAYRQQCARALDEVGDTAEARTAYLVARTCALAPDAVTDPAKLVEMAERAVQFRPEPHYLHTLGLAYYRAGQFDKAIELLHRSMKGNWRAHAANWLVLAMAHQRLGHAEEARKWFDKAVQWLDKTDPGPFSNTAVALQSLHQHDSLACMVLRREAEALLGIRP